MGAASSHMLIKGPLCDSESTPPRCSNLVNRKAHSRCCLPKPQIRAAEKASLSPGFYGHSRWHGLCGVKSPAQPPDLSKGLVKGPKLAPLGVQ